MCNTTKANPKGCNQDKECKLKAESEFLEHVVATHILCETLAGAHFGLQKTHRT